MRRLKKLHWRPKQINKLTEKKRKLVYKYYDSLRQIEKESENIYKDNNPYIVTKLHKIVELANNCITYTDEIRLIISDLNRVRNRHKKHP